MALVGTEIKDLVIMLQQDAKRNLVLIDRSSKSAALLPVWLRAQGHS